MTVKEKRILQSLEVFVHTLKTCQKTWVATHIEQHLRTGKRSVYLRGKPDKGKDKIACNEGLRFWSDSFFGTGNLQIS